MVSRWQRKIQSAIDDCSAFLLVMTPVADGAKWPREELAWAERQNKQIYGLLLGGGPWFGYTTIDVENVLDGALPGENLLSRLPGYRPRTLRPNARDALEAAALQSEHPAGIDLRGADLSGLSLANADLRELDLSGANLSRADLTGADLSRSNLTRADLTQARMQDARLVDARLSGAILFATDLQGADARQAEFTRAEIIGTNLQGAVIDGAHVFGVSAWNNLGEPSSSRDLLVTAQDEVPLTVDDLDVAQVMHQLATSGGKLRTILQAINERNVLLLGKFTRDEKVTLDVLRDGLRVRGYLPVLVDFEKSTTGNLTETIGVIAGMSRFVVAELSEARSVPHELMNIVPTMVPIVTLLREGQAPFAMSADLAKYPGVLPVHLYRDSEALAKGFDACIVEPAENMRSTLLARVRRPAAP